MPASESANVTITAPSGAGLAGVTDVFNNIRSIEYQIDRAIVSITESNGHVVEYEYGTVATVTHVIANNVATITIST